jgi:TPR repeat protein
LGVELGNSQAVYWHFKAADQGDEDAQKRISEMYAKERID